MKNKTKRTGHKATRPDDKRLKPAPGDGRGNPRKPAEQHRVQVPFTCSPEFLTRLDAAAQAAGMKRSAYLRHCAELHMITLEQTGQLKDGNTNEQP